MFRGFDYTPFDVLLYDFSISTSGYIEIMRTVLDHGGDGSLADPVGDLPIHYAAIGSKPRAILTLVDKGGGKSHHF